MCFKGGLTISGLDPPATQYSLIRIHILVAASGKKTQLVWQGQIWVYPKNVDFNQIMIPTNPACASIY